MLIGVRGGVGEHAVEGGVTWLCHGILLVAIDKLDLVGSVIPVAEDDAPVGARGDEAEADWWLREGVRQGFFAASLVAGSHWRARSWARV